MWVIDQAFRSRWLDIGHVRFLRVYGPKRSRDPEIRKNKTSPKSSHLILTEQAWSIKDLLFGFRVVLRGQDSSILIGKCREWCNDG